MLIQTAREAAEQLRELFEADASGPLAKFAHANGIETNIPVKGPHR